MGQLLAELDALATINCGGYEHGYAPAASTAVGGTSVSALAAGTGCVPPGSGAALTALRSPGPFMIWAAQRACDNHGSATQVMKPPHYGAAANTSTAEPEPAQAPPAAPSPALIAANTPRPGRPASPRTPFRVTSTPKDQ